MPSGCRLGVHWARSLVADPIPPPTVHSQDGKKATDPRGARGRATPTWVVGGPHDPGGVTSAPCAGITQRLAKLRQLSAEIGLRPGADLLRQRLGLGQVRVGAVRVAGLGRVTPSRAEQLAELLRGFQLAQQGLARLVSIIGSVSNCSIVAGTNLKHSKIMANTNARTSRVRAQRRPRIVPTPPINNAAPRVIAPRLVATFMVRYFRLSCSVRSFISICAC